MSPSVDATLLSLMSFVGQTLLLAASIAGLVFALRRWATGGTSAILAAAGFGLEVTVRVVGMGLHLAMPFLPGGTSPVRILLFSNLVFTFGTLVATALVIAALVSAWRQWDRAELADPARR